MTPLLRARDVTMRFGGHLALDGIDVDVVEGTITGLIGPNGAGKTTLFNVVTGLLSPTAGRIELGGRDITSLPPYRRTHLGLARTFQRLELFTSLTVQENVEVAGHIRRRWSLRTRAGGDPAAEAHEILELVGLDRLADADVADLPTGQGRLVELARALMARPRILLLDEPASGQDERETVTFGLLLSRLRDQGTTVLLVEHDMSLVMDVCDTIHVLDFGTIIARGEPAAIQRDPAVLSAYLGSDA